MPKITIDTEKLKFLITEELVDIKQQFVSETKAVIGQVGDIQIQLVMTDDDFEKVEEPNAENICVVINE